MIHTEVLNPGVVSSADLSERRSLLLELDGGFSNRGIRHRRRLQFQRSLSLLVSSRSVRAMRRVCNIVLAFVMIVLLAPIYPVLVLLAVLAGGGVRTRERLGRWATHFFEYELYFPESSRLARLAILSRLPAILNVLRGEMAFIGPRAVSPGDHFANAGRAAWRRYDLRPGLLSLWWIRKRANIAYTDETALDVEYVETNTFRGDLGIVLRALPAAFFGSEVACAPPEIHMLGIRIDNLTMAEAAARILALRERSLPAQVCFVNADCVNLACKDSSYLSTLTMADLVLADGIGVRIAGSWLGQNVRENVNGTDMLPFLCEAAAMAGRSIFLLGGRPGVASDAAAWMTERYPQLRVAGCRHGYFNESEEAGVIAEIHASGADILLVALGAPRQDNWIKAHREELGAVVSIGVGGLLDFYSGRIPRAPIWLREIGMEWFYRFYNEPRRMWRRYFIGNAIFLFRIGMTRMRLRDKTSPQEIAS